MLFLRAVGSLGDKATESLQKKSPQTDNHIYNTESQEKDWEKAVKLRCQKKKNSKWMHEKPQLKSLMGFALQNDGQRNIKFCFCYVK